MGWPEIERLIALLAEAAGLRAAQRAPGRAETAAAARGPHAAARRRAGRSGALPCGIAALCGNLDSRDPCAICADPERDRALICVVEGVGDLWALERAGVHRGLYHVLGGTLSALVGTGPEDLRSRRC